MNTIEAVLSALEGAGGRFIRNTTQGGRMYQLAGHTIFIPPDTGHMRHRAIRNLAAEVKRAIRDSRALGPGVKPVPGAPPVALGGPVVASPGPSGGPGDIEVAMVAPPAGNEEPPAPRVEPAKEEEVPKSYKCPDCDRSFDRPQGLGRHRAQVHNIKGKSRKSAPAQGSNMDRVFALMGELTHALEDLAKEHKELKAVIEPLMALVRK